jgi:hypothetical protein
MSNTYNKNRNNYTHDDEKGYKNPDTYEHKSHHKRINDYKNRNTVHNKNEKFSNKYENSKNYSDKEGKTYLC